jgi:nucleotide-binding universal stress UspA family protein
LSERSVDGIKYAFFLARGNGAEVVVVHVVDTKKVSQAGTMPDEVRMFFSAERMPAETLGHYFIEEVLERGRWKLNTFLSRYVDEETLRSVRLKKVVRLGQVVDEIIGASTAEGCDLIVMASGGKNWLARMVSGSLTEKVVRLASCPVLTIQPFTKVRQDGERVPVRFLIAGDSHV